MDDMDDFDKRVEEEKKLFLESLGPDFKLKVSAEETQKLLEYMAEVTKLIEEEPPHRSKTNPTKKWLAWHQKIEELNKTYFNVLDNFFMDCDSLALGTIPEDIEFADLIRDHLYIEPEKENPNTKRLEKISKKPSKYVMPNTNLAQSLPGRYDPETGEKTPIIGAGWFDLPALNKPKEITNYTFVDWDNLDNNITFSKEFTEQDLCNLNAICSLYEAGNRFVTPKMIQNAKSNQLGSEFVKPGTEKEVEESIEKMRHIFIRCDLSSEIKQRNKEAKHRGQQELTLEDGTPATNFAIDDYMLNLRKGTAKAKNTEVSGYYIEAQPILLEHAKVTGQLITIPAKMMDIKVVTNGFPTSVSIANSSNRQPIKEYLLRRIGEMKRNQKNKTKERFQTIVYDTLYRNAGVNIQYNTEKKRARNFVYQCLDFWTSVGYIKGYSESKRGKQIYSLEINL